MIRRLPVIATALLCASSALVAQSPDPPIFRAGVNLVALSVYVTDRQGNPVTDLAASDFDVREEGKRQAITSFSVVNLTSARPVAAPTVSGVEPDVQRNDAPEGRLFVFAIDELRPVNGLRARTILRRFITDHFGPNDIGTLVLVGRGRRDETQEFTTSRTLLLSAIDKITGWPPSDRDPIVLWYAMQDLMQSLGRIPLRHKAVVLVTEDVSVNALNAIETPLSATVQSTKGLAGEIAREAMRLALRSSVTVYPIDPAGASLADVVSGENEAGPSVDSDRARRKGELDRQANLRDLGAATGGFAVVATNNYDDAFARIARETSAYYLIGYSSDEKPNGKFRRLQVRVNRPGLEVHTINGYLAPKNGATPKASSPGSRVSDLLSSPIPIAGLPLTIFAVPYSVDDVDPGVTVAVQVPGDAITLSRKGDVYGGPIDVGFVLTGTKGAIPDVRYSVNLALKPETYARMRQGGLQILRELRLKPGMYQVRVGVAQPDGRAGSVLYDLEVPDFRAAAIAMTGVVLTSTLTSSNQVVAGSTALTKTLPQAISTVRRFAGDDVVSVHAEAYDNGAASTAHTTVVRVELRSGDGRAVKVLPEIRQQVDGKERASLRVQGELPLTGIPAGTYSIHVEVGVEGANGPRVARDIPIEIE